MSGQGVMLTRVMPVVVKEGPTAPMMLKAATVVVCPTEGCKGEFFRFVVIQQNGDRSHNHLDCLRCGTWFCNGGPCGQGDDLSGKGVA